MMQMNELKSQLKSYGYRLWFSGLVLCVMCVCIYGMEQVQLVKSYEQKAIPGTTFNGIDVSNLSESEIESVIQKQKLLYEDRIITVTVDGEMFMTRLSYFDPFFSQSTTSLAHDIVSSQKNLPVRSQAKLIKNESGQNFELTYEYNSLKVYEYASDIFERTHVVSEPTFSQVGDSISVQNNSLERGIETTALHEAISHHLNEYSEEPIQLVLQTDTLTNKRNRGLLEITDKIASYETAYDETLTRAQNIETAAALIDQVVVYPNELFSFTERVLPVTADNGYTIGTIFVNAKPVQGMGGGICQVTSTLYNAILQAGLVASERQNHSLMVDYVPQGLDATMTDNGVDLKFVNTYDVPLYIKAKATDGVLTVELWSEKDLLKGVDYEPESTVSKDGAIHSTLYGYVDGEIVSKTFLHTSQYK